MALTIKLTPGYTYTDNELDTAAKRNLAANPTIDLEGTVSTLAIADGSVTTPKLVDGVLSADAAGLAKMADGFLSADAAGRGKMADGYITAAKVEETLRQGVPQYAAGVFTAGTYAITLNPAATGYTAGMRVMFKPDTTNTGVTSLNVNGLGAKTLKALGTADLAAGRILASQIIEAVYDGTNFQLVNETNRFDIGETSLAVGLIVNVAHSLARAPSLVRAVLRCKTAELGYSVGNEITAPDLFFAAGGSATNVFIVCANATPNILRKDTFVLDTITAANWKVVGYVRL